MKIKEIFETQRISDPSLSGSAFAEKHGLKWLTHGQDVADIEDYRLKQFNNYYSLWDDGILVGFLRSDSINPNKDPDYPDYLIEDIYITPEYRNQRILSKMLWCLKTRFGHDSMILGEKHSDKMQEVTTGLSKFKKYWFNIDTGERQEFGTPGDYYSDTGKTNWRLVLENTADYAGFPRFNDGSSYIREGYEHWID